MNDLDLVRTMRAAVSRPTQDRLAAGRDRILAAASRPHRYRRLALPARRPELPVRRLALAVGAVTAAAAVAVASVAVLGGTATPSRPRPAPVGHASLAARVLTVAAQTVAAAPAARPGSRQWVYSKFVQTETGQPTQSDESWTRFDGLEQAYILNGKLIVQHEPSGSGGRWTTTARWLRCPRARRRSSPPPARWWGPRHGSGRPGARAAWWPG
jgi:hypothetical protein